MQVASAYRRYSSRIREICLCTNLIAAGGRGAALSPGIRRESVRDNKSSSPVDVSVTFLSLAFNGAEARVSAGYLVSSFRGREDLRGSHSGSAVAIHRRRASSKERRRTDAYRIGLACRSGISCVCARARARSDIYFIRLLSPALFFTGRSRRVSSVTRKEHHKTTHRAPQRPRRRGRCGGKKSERRRRAREPACVRSAASLIGGIPF